MILKNPFFIIGLVLMGFGNTWFVLLKFKEWIKPKPIAAISVLPVLLVLPATAMGSPFIYKKHRGTKLPIWISILGLLLCFFVQAYRS